MTGNGPHNVFPQSHGLFFILPGSELRVRGLDLHIAENRKAHHTNEYEHECLIVRRGQQFKASLTFDREYNEAQDTVIVQFSTG